jgi:isoquinoline 1-oxidoreductase beta subunit
MSASFNRLGAAASRREFLKVSVAAGGGLLLGFAMPRGQAAEQAGSTVAPFAPDAFIRIDRNGTVTLIMCQVEMGQGVYTSMSQILADELDVDFGRVVVEAAPPNDALYTNAALGFQVTGGSTSIRVFWMPMRKAGASARAMLVEAAAAIWRADPGTCRTSNSEVIHGPSGRRLPYGALVDRAAHLTPPKNPTLKSRKDFQLIGTPARRLDSPHKVDGRAMFGIDAMPPGVKFATLRSCPVFGGKVAHVDEAGARQVPGVRQWWCSMIWSQSSATTCGPPRRDWMRCKSNGTMAQMRRSIVNRFSSRSELRASAMELSPNRSATSARL